MATREEYRMRSRLPAAVGGLVLFAGGGVFCFAFEPPALGSLRVWLGGLSAALMLVAAVAVVNLVRHEGWAVVLTETALELPVAPYRSSRRQRVPLAAIELVAIVPEPPAAPTFVTIHVSPGPQIRWIRQVDLVDGTVGEIAVLLIDRVEAVRGPGRVVRGR